MARFDVGTILENLDNPNMQNLIRNSPDLQRDLDELRERNFASQKVTYPEGDPTLGTMVPVDKGIVGAVDDFSGGVLGMALSYADPRAAAGVAIFGLGLVALPLIAQLHGVDEGLEVEKVGVREAVGFSYDQCQRTREDEDFEKPLSLEALRHRLGAMDPSSMAAEILLSEAEASEKGRCTEQEIGRLQQCVLSARAAVRRLRRRSALAFMGLSPSASADEVNQKYKRMALEMHPDKGGDAERFQQLQEMKGRLTKSLQEEEDEEERIKAQEEEDKKNLPPTAKAKQLRREAHKEAVKLWDSAREAEAEMLLDKSSLRGIAGPVISRLRSYVEQFANSRCRMLPHGNKAKAREAFWEFKRDGLELIALGALLDPSGTASLIANNINYKIVSRSGSKEAAAACQSLLEAIGAVQQRVENFLVEMSRERAAALDAEDAQQAEEEQLGGNLTVGEPVVLTGDDLGEDELQGQHGTVLGPSEGNIAVRLTSGRRVVVPRAGLRRAPRERGKASSAQPPRAAHTEEVGQATATSCPEEALPSEMAQAPRPTLIARQPAAVLAGPRDPERSEWDPNFSHPYVGAMDGKGNEIFCRACCRWIATRKYAHEPFLRHARVAHTRPPQGWRGAVPSMEE